VTSTNGEATSRGDDFPVDLVEIIAMCSNPSPALVRLFEEVM
jgi:hypothetical protein